MPFHTPVKMHMQWHRHCMALQTLACLLRTDGTDVALLSREMGELGRCPHQTATALCRRVIQVSSSLNFAFEECLRQDDGEVGAAHCGGHTACLLPACLSFPSPSGSPCPPSWPACPTGPSLCPLSPREGGFTRHSALGCLPLPLLGRGGGRSLVGEGGGTGEIF